MHERVWGMGGITGALALPDCGVPFSMAFGSPLQNGFTIYLFHKKASLNLPAVLPGAVQGTDVAPRSCKKADGALPFPQISN